jgi:amidophosphoribosyltransferase
MGGVKPSLVKVFSNLSKKFDGAYNIAFINAYGDIAVVRDPLGIRPLSYGYNNNTLLIASESNALINCGVKNFKELEPGKMIIIKNNDVGIKRFAKRKRKAHCMFEWVYFSNVGSILNGKSVYITRTNLGKELAKLETEKITKDHVLVPVPDTAKAAGDAMAFELGIPSQEGLVRNRFVGRTFIEGFSREDKVENKYTALREILKGKKVILVDDSIVRGTTSKRIVRYLKTKGGAKEVHLRVSCPPIIAPCFYGIDMSTISELLVPNYEKRFNNDEVSEKAYKKIANALGADSVIYQTIPGLIKSIGLPKKDLCMACLNRNYPTPCGKRLFDKVLEKYKKGIKEKKRSYEC